MGNDRYDFLKRFEDGGDFSDCHGVISGNHTRLAYYRLKTEHMNNPTPPIKIDIFNKAIRHNVIFFLLILV
jgi:hypothetical protein